MLEENVLTVCDENGLGEVHHTLELRFDQAKVSVRDIITERVFREVEKYNNRAADYRNSLVVPREEEQALNKKTLKRANPEKQLQVALEAFEGNGYFVLINDRQADSLDDEVVVTADATISFVKLTPIVGG